MSTDRSNTQPENSEPQAGERFGGTTCSISDLIESGVAFLADEATTGIGLAGEPSHKATIGTIMSTKTGLPMSLDELQSFGIEPDQSPDGARCLDWLRQSIEHPQ